MNQQIAPLSHFPVQFLKLFEWVLTKMTTNLVVDDEYIDR